MKNMGEKFFALEKCSTFVLVKFVAFAELLWSCATNCPERYVIDVILITHNLK
jgi:hypothetical protein